MDDGPPHTQIFFFIALCSFPGDFRLAFVTTSYSRCINEETEVCRGGVSELSTIHVSEGQGRKPAQAQSGARCVHVPRTPPHPPDPAFFSLMFYLDSYYKSLMDYPLAAGKSRSQQAFTVKDQIVHVLGFCKPQSLSRLFARQQLQAIHEQMSRDVFPRNFIYKTRW